MSIYLRKPMTLDEFLAWEHGQELRYEFDGAGPVAMAGGTYNHDRIATNLAATLVNRLRGSPCRPSGPNMKVRTGTGTLRYPDAFVVCRPVPPRELIIDDPVVVFEVVSDETSRTDRIVKMREYQATPSIQRYIILEQNTIGALALARKDQSWIAEALDENEILRLPEAGIEIH